MAQVGEQLNAQQRVALARGEAERRKASLVHALRMADRAILEGQPVTARRHLNVALRALGGR